MGELEQTGRSYELRSEKARSIVGQIPPSLVRYGTTIIGCVLLCLVALAYFIPYRQIYSGVATIHNLGNHPVQDSIETTLLLLFEIRSLQQASQHPILLSTPSGPVMGKLLTLSATRDTLNRQEACCRFKANDIQLLADQTVDFQLILSDKNLLKRMFDGL